MFITGDVIHAKYFGNNNKCEYDLNSELHIDLDFNDNMNTVKESDQPMDLSIMKVNDNKGDVSKLENKTSDIKMLVVTEREISILIDPFYHGSCRYDGHDQQMVIFHLLLHQSSNGPISAKQIHRCSSLIGRQY
jgi:hypothetical protein